ncbi:Tc toxin subunit A-related protein [Pseudomonas sp. CFBP 13727]|uniref:Tc toxin subunit A-related protein n=1 Tax=Pseudomonas sp. CFBP 13727 TaxID=2775295 RepID=UPI00177D4518|nr:neuraminidase-like domain-containing protein [Pseudomonas sp. CFBP 13727]MBD8622370.1 toxin [Pseudomonas sp. CFBP 13727]
MTIAATLNESFRDALVAYYLGEVVPNDATLADLGLANKLKTENDLYEYLLLDTQVTQAVETSPVASAIASLQQYINGALLGMEPGYNDVRFSEALLGEWRDQRSQYPLWAANQQLAWYPSLYIDPSLRMKKSSYFQQLENDINQNRISLDTTQEAVQNYLASFEEVANLSIINGYIAGTDFKESTYYFIGKSRAEGAYYWRSVNMAERTYVSGTQGPKVDNPNPGAWSDWKRANLPISDTAIEHTIRPVYFNNRLFVVWVEYVESVEPGGSGDLEATPPEDGKYPHRSLTSSKPKMSAKLRLNLTYKKYDDSWSAPQCYMDVDVDPGSAAMLDVHTVAVVDKSTNPEGLLMLMHKGYSTGANNDGTRDTYKCLKSLKLDKNFVTTALFPERGMVDDDTSDTGIYRLMVLRAGRLFANANAGRFQFPVTAGVISIKSVSTTSPHPNSSEVQGWNYLGWQDRVGNSSVNRQVTFNATTNRLSFSSHVATAFTSEQEFNIECTNTGFSLSLIGLKPTDATSDIILDARSTFRATYDAFKQNFDYTFYKSREGTFTPFLKNSTGSNLTLNASSGTASLAGKRLTRAAFDRLTGSDPAIPPGLGLTITHTSSGVFFHQGLLNALPNTLTQNYQQFLARATSVTTPTPPSMTQKTNLKVAPTATSELLPGQHNQSIDIAINPETLRPDWSANFPDTTFTVIHGVYVTQRGVGVTRSLGHCCKATKIELQAIGSGDSLRAPKISRHTNPTLGTVEYIDFANSTIAKNDNDNANRQPIRMNTLFARNLIERANVALENLLSWETQCLPEPGLGNGSADPFMDFKGANGLYFWELFFHLPFLISHRLNTEQQFSEAEHWLSFIFDPSRRADSSGRPDYWNVRPLVDDLSRERATRAPIDPDGIASDNPVHYRKAVYSHFVRNLLDRGDAAYRQLTPDALNEAKLWYVRVLDLLGPRPDKRLVSGWKPLTLKKLSDSVSGGLRAFEQRLIEQERLVAESAAENDGRSLIIFQQPPLALMPFAVDPSLAELDSPHFRVALNRELVQNWDTAEARLRNLRHNRTLDGKPLQLPLFAAPLDPRALMSAFGSAAAGGGSGRLLGQEIPHYRFSVMHNRASAAVENLIQFGSTLLSLLERKDNAQLQEMQQQQAWDMAKQAIVLQQLVQGVEAEGRKALLASRAIAENRLSHYATLASEVVSAGEVSAGALHLQGRVAEGVGFVSQAIGEGLKVAPNQVGAVGGVIAGMAGGAIVGATTGGWRLEGVTGIATAVAQGMATAFHGAAEALDRTEQYRRRHQEWMHAEDQAKREIEQIDAQLAVHDEQAKVTAEQLRQTELMVDQAATTYQFLNKRFTNAQLYQWLNGQFATFYYQAYDTTLSLCLAAEACWQYEIADLKTRFIQPGAWKDSYRGLTAGESLKLNLMKMEAAYLQRNARSLEITKTVSVRRLQETEAKPWATIVEDLGKTGGLEIKLEQGLFDNDYPGQYLRRIKRVSVTLPAVLGPYEDLAAVLTQTYSKVEMADTVGANVWENMRASQQIALSSGVDDDGMFTLNFDDERYLPFEGTGAVSTWNLRFTRSTPELLAALSDVIVRVSYTAKSA